MNDELTPVESVEPTETPADETAPTEELGEADVVADEPAAEGEEAPAEPEPAPVEEAQAEVPSSLPAAPVATEPDPKLIEAQQKAAAEFRELVTEFSTLSTDLEKDDFDVLEKGPSAMKTLSKALLHLDRKLDAISQQAAVATTKVSEAEGWVKWGRDNPTVGAEKGRTTFEAAVAEAERMVGGQSRDAVFGAAKVIFSQKVQAMKKPAAPAKTVAPKPVAPVTRTGGQVAPKGTARPPAPKPMSAADKLLKQFGSPDKVLL